MNTNNKNSTPNTTVTRDVRSLDVATENVYESIVVISKRANQISATIKEELNNKLQEFASSNDNLEEVFENREQIEISKYYERMPKPTLLSTQEFLEDKIYHRTVTEEEYLNPLLSRGFFVSPYVKRQENFNSCNR
jgi:DNA-directed RNA polymerase subunit K/omega